jgi:hypothetical protein
MVPLSFWDFGKVVVLVSDHCLYLHVAKFNLIHVLINSVDVHVDHSFKLNNFGHLCWSVLLKQRFIIFDLQRHFILGYVKRVIFTLESFKQLGRWVHRVFTFIDSALHFH